MAQNLMGFQIASKIALSANRIGPTKAAANHKLSKNHLFDGPPQQNPYDFLARAELLGQLKVTQSQLNKAMIKAEPTEEADKQAAGNVKTRLETEINNIKTALKATKAAPHRAPPRPGRLPDQSAGKQSKLIKFFFEENSRIFTRLEKS